MQEPPSIPPASPLDALAANTPVRILVAGNGAARDLLAQQLTTCGHRVVATASTPTETLVQARAVRPEVVFLDLHLAGDATDDLAAALAAEAPDVAVVQFADAADPSRPAGRPAAGHAFAVLPVPTRREELEITVRSAATHARARVAAGPAAADDRAAVDRATHVLMQRTGCSEREAGRLLTEAAEEGAGAVAAVARVVLASTATPHAAPSPPGYPE